MVDIQAWIESAVRQKVIQWVNRILEQYSNMRAKEVASAEMLAIVNEANVEPASGIVKVALGDASCSNDSTYSSRIFLFLKKVAPRCLLKPLRLLMLTLSELWDTTITDRNMH